MLNLTKVSKMNLKFKKIVISIFSFLTPFIVGGISGLATFNGLKNWYNMIEKPSFNPPNYIFGPVWSALYFLMGISFYLIVKRPKSELRKKAIIIFLLQLFLNFCWSFIFFQFHQIGLAFLEIILIWISILFMIIRFYKINKYAALLQIPYLLWVSFACFLNGTIWYLNS